MDTYSSGISCIVLGIKTSIRTCGISKRKNIVVVLANTYTNSYYHKLNEFAHYGLPNRSNISLTLYKIESHKQMRLATTSTCNIGSK